MNPIIHERLDEITKICRTYKVKSLYSFGSINTGKFKNESDIDLLISFQDISVEEYTDNYFDLHKIFENMFQRQVDLVTTNSLSNPYFIKSIDQTKSLIYEG